MLVLSPKLGFWLVNQISMIATHQTSITKWRGGVLIYNDLKTNYIFCHLTAHAN